MDYIMNIQNSNNSLVPEFLYDDRRCCSKICILFKIMGCIFYTMTLSRCDKAEIYIVMITAMILSTLNDMRYEYCHYMKLGTIFSSLDEFELWKRAILPQLKIVFSGAEFAIKLVFLIKNFPPEFDFSFKNICKLGDSTFKLHILILFSLYFIIGALLCMIMTCIYFPKQVPRQIRIITLPNPIILNNLQTEECSICMDLDNTKAWIMLPCGHKFHNSCIVQWLNTQQNCPICRHNVAVL
jgi:hypothetical protein